MTCDGLLCDQIVPIGAWEEPLRSLWLCAKRTSMSSELALGRFLWWRGEIGLSWRPPLTVEEAEDFLAHLRSVHHRVKASMFFSALYYAARVVWAGDWRWLRQRWEQDLPARQTSRRQVRVSVPYEEWSVEDKRLFELITRPASGPSEHSGSAAHLRPATIKGLVHSYGCWLHEMRAAGLSENISYESLQFFIRRLKARHLRPRTIAKMVSDLDLLIRRLRPEADTALLRSTATLLGAWARATPKLKAGAVVEPGLVWHLGITLINAARDSGPPNRESALLFRNGLLLCMLSCIPLRARTVACMALRPHLELFRSGGMLHFSPAETKENREDHRVLPEWLSHVVREYLAHYRDHLLFDDKISAFWVSDLGGPLSAQSIGKIVGDLTLAAFDIRIPAHRLRDCVATMLKEQYPDQADHMASVALNHGSPAVTREYQESARQIFSQNKLLSFRETLINQMRPRRTGRPTRSLRALLHAAARRRGSKKAGAQKTSGGFKALER
jgi:hypothetical protein